MRQHDERQMTPLSVQGNSIYFEGRDGDSDVSKKPAERTEDSDQPRDKGEKHGARPDVKTNVSQSETKAAHDLNKNQSDGSFAEDRSKRSIEITAVDEKGKPIVVASRQKSAELAQKSAEAQKKGAGGNSEHGAWSGPFTHQGTGTDRAVSGKEQPSGRIEPVRKAREVQVLPQLDSTLIAMEPNVEARAQASAEASPDSRKTHMSPEALKQAAASVHDALNANVLGLPIPDVKKVLDTVEPMSALDKAMLLQTYQSMYKKDLRAEAAERLMHDDQIKVKAVIHRGDHKADDLASVETALSRLHTVALREEIATTPSLNPNTDSTTLPNSFDLISASTERRFLEKQLRETLGSLAPGDLDRLARQYAEAHKNPPRDLKTDLLQNPDISEETRQSLNIYLRCGAKLSSDDVRQLAEIGLRSKNADIFQEAFITTRDSQVRDEYSSETKAAQIDGAFGNDAAIARDYVDAGHIKLSTLVRGDTHWWHKDKNHIEYSLANASKEEHSLYLRGMDLAYKTGNKNHLPEDEKAVKFYNDLKDALSHASGSPRELAQWEAELTRGGGLISRVTALHDDGFFGMTIGAPHDFNKVLQAVDEMSNEDWLQLHDPSYRQQFERATGTFLDRAEQAKLSALVEEKLKAPSFEESKRCTPGSIGLKYEKPASVNAEQEKAPDLPPGSTAADAVHAFVNGQHNVSADFLRKALSNPQLDLEQMANEYAEKYHGDLNSTLLSKVSQTDRLDFIRLLSPVARNPRQDFYAVRDSAHEHDSALGDIMMKNLSNYSQVQADDSQNRLYGFVQENESTIEALSAEKVQEFERLYATTDSAQESYIESKRQFSEEFVNASIGLAAMAGSVVTVGGSWELYVTAMAVGGTYKAAAKAAIEGSDYRADPMHVGCDVLGGGISTGVAFLGPEMLGVGKIAANNTARSLLQGSARDLISSEVTEQTLKNELTVISRKILNGGTGGAEEIAKRELTDLAGRIAKPGHEAALARQLMEISKKEMTDASSKFLSRGIYEYSVVAGSGGAGGMANVFQESLFTGNFEDFGQRSINGFLTGALSASAFNAAFKGVAKVVEVATSSGVKRFAEFNAGGTILRSEDGIHWHSSERSYEGVLVRTATGEVKLKTTEGEIVNHQDGTATFKDLNGRERPFAKPVSESGDSAPQPQPGAQRHNETESVALTEPPTRVGDALKKPSPGELSAEAPPRVGPILNLAVDEPITFMNREWKVARIDESAVTLSRTLAKEANAMDLRSCYDERQIAQLEVGRYVRLHQHDTTMWRIESIDRTNRRFVLSGEESTPVRIRQLLVEHPDLIRSTPQQLMSARGDARVEQLKTAQILRSERYYGDGYYDMNDPDIPEKYIGTMRDKSTGKEMEFVLHPIDDIKMETRMKNEIRAQWFTRWLGFDNGYPATAVREVEIEGVKRWGLLQEKAGQTMQKSFPNILSKKLYGSGETPVELTTQELALVLKPARDPQSLLQQLKDQPAAYRRFEQLINDKDRMMALRSDAELPQLKRQLEQAIIERHIMGDFDDHAENLLVLMDDTGKYRIRNFDMDFAFSKNEEPVFHRRAKVGKFNNHVFEALEQSPLSIETVQTIQHFVDNPETRSTLVEIGFSDSEIRSIMNRAQFYLQHKRFPQLKGS